jgi:glycosyltransferase involved in cell wall biosynthesis
MRSQLLYVSPVVPALAGNGLAMRAGMVLEALAAHHAVSLFVHPRYGPVGPVPDALARRCRRVAVGRRAYRWRRFDVIHVFRLASVPAARPFVHSRLWNRHARRHLDLDDLESETHARLAALGRASGDADVAEAHDRLAADAVAAEAEAFARFHRVYVCSAIDRAKLAGRTGAEVRVLPNAVRTREGVPPRPLDGPFLFVGTLGYYPNEDACRWLVGEIAPRVPEIAFRVVGTGATEGLRRRLGPSTVRLIGEVADVAPAYHEASVVVVPLRAGGGTRIKILEAFAFRRPVITTTAGLEGLDVAHEACVLVADTPEEFAHACRRLRDDRGLAERLVANAHAWVERFGSVEAVRRALADASLPPTC